MLDRLEPCSFPLVAIKRFSILSSNVINMFISCPSKWSSAYVHMCLLKTSKEIYKLIISSLFLIEESKCNMFLSSQGKMCVLMQLKEIYENSEI